MKELILALFSKRRLAKGFACAVVAATTALTLPAPAGAGTLLCTPDKPMCWENGSSYPDPYDSGGSDAYSEMYVYGTLVAVATFHAKDEVVVLKNLRGNGARVDVWIQYISPADNWHYWHYTTESRSRTIELGDGDLAEGQYIGIRVGAEGRHNSIWAHGTT